MKKIKVVVVDNDGKTLFEDAYDDIVMIGELIRNLCVNLCIDPDTVDGYTKNVDVLLNSNIWQYRPSAMLKDQSILDNKLVLSINVKKSIAYGQAWINIKLNDWINIELYVLFKFDKV